MYLINITHSDQLDLCSHIAKERDELKYRLARYDDFWEWYEEHYGETEVEVWDKFEKHEDLKKANDTDDGLCKCKDPKPRGYVTEMFEPYQLCDKCTKEILY